MQIISALILYGFWFLGLLVVFAVLVASYNLIKKSYQPGNVLLVLIPAILLFTVLSVLATFSYLNFSQQNIF